ncbi:MAG: phospholipid/cholesterol/gamma-HCH transport system substrate-binding protein [Frankiaceae bacterium]|jgi:phospholipid/cholesterol/gamma-HCH transport system substrate-binding protein|nr:phospholipid/cholesterol/gamma-HCH transport system substrate-binding protein [Frankiaceae bacterium]
MRPFRERNPLPIGIIGIVSILAVVLLAFNANKLPFIGGGDTYHADFADAAGLKTGDDVRIAGVKVGKVTSLDLRGAMVRVGFQVSSGTDVGPDTKADIKIKTLLGQKYIALTPDGSGTLHGDIPLSQTTTPLDVTEAFNQLGKQAGQIDTAMLAKAFDTIADTFKDTPPYVHESLVGLRRLSTSIASRDSQLTQLLADTNTVTETLAARDAEVAKLINDSNLILDTVYQQRAVIHNLLVDTSAVAKQLSGLVRENRAIIGPALANLEQTLTILQRNQDNLDQTIHLAAPFIRDFTDVLGNGRWFETVLWNLPGGAAQGCLQVAGGPDVCPPFANPGANR